MRLHSVFFTGAPGSLLSARVGRRPSSFIHGRSPWYSSERNKLATAAAALVIGCVFATSLFGNDEKTAPTSAPYIDTHNHLFKHKDNADFDGDADRAIEAMKKFRIGKMILSPPPYDNTQRGAYDYPAFLASLQRHPGSFAFLGGGGTLNVMIHAHAKKPTVTEALKKRFEAEASKILSAGALGFGEMSAEHFSFERGHPYQSVAPDHPLFLLLADIAAHNDVPIDLHMEAVPEEMLMPETERLDNGENPRRLSANIAAFERLLEHNPQARIIWAHAGWDNTGKRTAQLCKQLLQKHPNLYMSIKLGKGAYEENNPVSETGEVKKEWLELFEKYPDRFIIGTDQFYVSATMPVKKEKRIDSMRRFLDVLPPDLAQQFGITNPRRIFNLK